MILCLDLAPAKLQNLRPVIAAEIVISKATAVYDEVAAAMELPRDDLL
jgi:hypothetical protein